MNSTGNLAVLANAREFVIQDEHFISAQTINIGAEGLWKESCPNSLFEFLTSSSFGGIRPIARSRAEHHLCYSNKSRVLKSYACIRDTEIRVYRQDPSYS